MTTEQERERYELLGVLTAAWQGDHDDLTRRITALDDADLSRLGWAGARITNAANLILREREQNTARRQDP